MAKKFSELRAKMSLEAKAESERLFQKDLSEMPLCELRNARGLTQEMLAETLLIQQPAIAKMGKFVKG
jgi:DNA-binding XRE family transcriptional regulator